MTAALAASQPASERPLVSVIVNVWNGAPTVREAIRSVLDQTWPRWEMIVWDDGSTDGSPEIVAEFRDPRIRLFCSPENRGLGRARDAALGEARGDWIAFLDQDDVWLPRKLELQLALGADPRVGLVYGRTVRFNGRGREREYDHRHEFEPLPEGDIFETLFTHSCYIAMSSAMLRRAAVQSIGAIPDEITVIPDYFLFLEVARRWKARAVQQEICRYRDHGAAMSHSNVKQMQREMLLLVERWGSALSSELKARRIKIHSTVLAWDEMLSLPTFFRGARRLTTDGSPAFLLSRPFARALRLVRRRVRNPYYRRVADGVRPMAADRIEMTSATAGAATLPLSVIVVNWNVCDLLRDALRSLETQMTLRSEEWELIVVDNHSSDGSVEMIRREFPHARLVVNDQNVGFGRANNQAFRISRGRNVLLLNPDTLVRGPAVERMMAWMDEHPGVGALGCRLLNGDGSFQRWTGGHRPTRGNVLSHFLFLYKLLPGWLLPPPLYLETDPTDDLEVGWVSGACMLLRRDALGGELFDEGFFIYGEDVDLCDRLRRSGWRVVYTPKIEIVHYGGRSLARQSSEVHLSKLAGMRRVFAARHGTASMFFYDVIVTAGFALRFAVHKMLDVVRPGAGFAPLAEMSGRFCAEAFRTLLRGPRQTPSAKRSPAVPARGGPTSTPR